MPSSPRTLISRLLPWLVIALLVVLIGVIYLGNRTSPVNLTETISIDGSGVARQDGRIVGRPGLDGLLRLQLVTPKTSEEVVSGQIELDFSDLQSQENIGINFISIQGTSSLNSQWIDSRTAYLNLGTIVPDSYTSVVITSHTGFQSGGLQKIERWLSSIDHVTGAAVGTFAYILITLYSLWLGRHVLRKGSAIAPLPPEGLRPIQLAILDHGTITPADLIALLFDLAERGYLQIIQGPHGILFLRTNLQEGLLDYERGLLALLFPEQSLSHLEDILASLDHDLFSAAVGQIYIEIYASFEAQGYFEENPRFTHLRLKLVAIILQLAGLFYASLGCTLLTGFPIVLWLGIGIFLGGLMLYRAAKRVVHFSPGGREYLKQGSAFISYLASPEPIGQEGTQAVLLYQLIPYALASNTAQAWLRRFRNRSCSIPQWYSSQDEAIVEPILFLRRIDQTTRAISKVMVTLKDPNVD